MLLLANIHHYSATTNLKSVCERHLCILHITISGMSIPIYSVAYHPSHFFLYKFVEMQLDLLPRPMPHNQCQSTQLWGLQHLWLANEVSLPAHHRVPNWPEPGQRGAVGVCMSQPSRTYRLTNMQLNWPSVTSLSVVEALIFGIFGT